MNDFLVHGKPSGKTQKLGDAWFGNLESNPVVTGDVSEIFFTKFDRFFEHGFLKMSCLIIFSLANVERRLGKFPTPGKSICVRPGKFVSSNSWISVPPIESPWIAALAESKWNSSSEFCTGRENDADSSNYWPM